MSVCVYFKSKQWGPCVPFKDPWSQEMLNSSRLVYQFWSPWCTRLKDGPVTPWPVWEALTVYFLQICTLHLPRPLPLVPVTMTNRVYDLASWWWDHSLLLPLLGFGIYLSDLQASLVAQMVKRLPTMWETQVRSLGWEDPLEKEMATHPSILAWEIPWTEDPVRLQSIGVAERWTRLNDFTFLFLRSVENKVFFFLQFLPLIFSPCFASEQWGWSSTSPELEHRRKSRVHRSLQVSPHS